MNIDTISDFDFFTKVQFPNPSASPAESHLQNGANKAAQLCKIITSIPNDRLDERKPLEGKIGARGSVDTDGKGKVEAYVEWTFGGGSTDNDRKSDNDSESCASDKAEKKDSDSPNSNDRSQRSIY